MNGGWLSDELLALLQVEQGQKDEDQWADAKEEAVLQDGAFPDDGMDVLREAVGIERNVPHGVLEEWVAQEDEGYSQNDDDERCGISVAGERGKEEGQTTHEQYGEHEAPGHAQRTDGKDQKIGDGWI